MLDNSINEEIIIRIKMSTKFWNAINYCRMEFRKKIFRSLHKSLYDIMGGLYSGDKNRYSLLNCAIFRIFECLRELDVSCDEFNYKLSEIFSIDHILIGALSKKSPPRYWRILRDNYKGEATLSAQECRTLVEILQKEGDYIRQCVTDNCIANKEKGNGLYEIKLMSGDKMIRTPSTDFRVIIQRSFRRSILKSHVKDFYCFIAKIIYHVESRLLYACYSIVDYLCKTIHEDTSFKDIVSRFLEYANSVNDKEIHGRYLKIMSNQFSDQRFLQINGVNGILKADQLKKLGEVFQGEDRFISEFVANFGEQSLQSEKNLPLVSDNVTIRNGDVMSEITRLSYNAL